MTVVKLLSAEQRLDYNEAKIYIDVSKVYSKYDGVKNPENEWMKLLQLNYNLGKDKKISNNIDYYKYNIEEVISKKKATVSLIDKDTNKSIKKIVYSLEFIENRWIVVSIEYIK
ncbi:MAG: hypothetical protein ACLS8C_13925 [Dysgonomonas mossii]